MPRGWGREATKERGRRERACERGYERSGLAQAEQLFQIVFFVEDPGGGAKEG